MKKYLYDLLIGNIPGARSKPAENWHLREDNKVEVSAATTHAQAEREKKTSETTQDPHRCSTRDQY